MILTEYNEELHIKNEKNISYDEGCKKTRKEDIAIFREFCLEIGFSDPQILQTVMDKFQLSETEATKYLNDYHKAHPQ